jgi:hypothetical protein
MALSFHISSSREFAKEIHLAIVPCVFQIFLIHTLGGLLKKIVST